MKVTNVTPRCGHLLCELADDHGTCSIATGRSRGCTPGLSSRELAPGVFDEVRRLLGAIDEGDRAAAVRLAEIIRREAREDRHLLALARSDEPDLVPALERLCLRRTA
jgi:hypothetical protein